MAAKEKSELNGVLGWVDERFPLLETWKAHMSEYYAPKNFNVWYYKNSFSSTEPQRNSAYNTFFKNIQREMRGGK